MCGRFDLHLPREIIAEIFGISILQDIQPRYNIAPTQQVAVIRTYDVAFGSIRGGEIGGRFIFRSITDVVLRLFCSCPGKQFLYLFVTILGGNHQRGCAVIHFYINVGPIGE